jgi:hypothetical protein
MSVLPVGMETTGSKVPSEVTSKAPRGPMERLPMLLAPLKFKKRRYFWPVTIVVKSAKIVSTTTLSINTEPPVNGTKNSPC